MPCPPRNLRWLVEQAEGEDDRERNDTRQLASKTQMDVREPGPLIQSCDPPRQPCDVPKWSTLFTGVCRKRWHMCCSAVDDATKLDPPRKSRRAARELPTPTPRE